MALCGAAHLLCGERQEALTITEKLPGGNHAGHVLFGSGSHVMVCLAGVFVTFVACEDV